MLVNGPGHAVVYLYLVSVYDGTGTCLLDREYYGLASARQGVIKYNMSTLWQRHHLS